MNIFKYLASSVPIDHCKQTRAVNILKEELGRGVVPKRVLDFGCGDGRTIDLFGKLLPNCDWRGVDIESSPEVNSRTRTDPRFVTYDGLLLPFKNSEFDLVYSHQVLEHVRKPEEILREIKRVLRPGGLFVGQTSQFEPYHSFSLWNFTIYGFKKIVEEAGFELAKIRPAVDGFTLMERAYRGRPKEFDRYAHEESPRNVEIENKALMENKSVQVINFRKLMYSGSFSFVCR